MSKRLPKTQRYFNAQTLAIQESVARVNRVHELLEVLVSLQHPSISFKRVDQKLFQSSLPRHIEILQEQVQSLSKDSYHTPPSTLKTSDSNSFNTIDMKHTAQASSEKLSWENLTYHQDKKMTEDETGNFTTSKYEVIPLSRPSPQLAASLPTLTTMGPAPPARVLFPVGPIAQMSVPVQPFLGPPISFQPMPLVSSFGPQNLIGFSGPQTPVNNLEQEKLRERLITFIKEMSPSVPGLKGSEGELTRFLLNRWDHWKLLDMMETPAMLKEQIALVFGDLQQHLKERDVKIQKQMLGERLYKAIMLSLPTEAKEKACKVTGMLLELDNSEVNNLLENPQDLEDKVEEALAVLKAHETLHKGKRKSSSSAASDEEEIHEPNTKILTSEMLTGLPPEEQKQMIGEKLYTAVLGMSRSQTVRKNVGKIVGMLLEINNSELLNLLKKPKDLEHKVQEALAVLEAYNKKDSQVSKKDVCSSTSVTSDEEEIHESNREILTSEMIDGLPPQEQKQMIGEKLYTTVLGMSRSQTVRKNVGKIVSMLLEIDNSKLLNLLEEPKDLQNVVEEVLAVLEAHKKKDSHVSKIYVCRSQRYAKRRIDKRQKLTSSSSSDSFYDTEESIKDQELDEFFDLLKL